VHVVSSLRMGLSCRGSGRGMIEYASTIYTIYSSAAVGANCWIRSSNNALTSV
jgi:hypothetical protein